MFDVVNKSIFTLKSDCAVIVYASVKALKQELKDSAIAGSIDYLKKTQQVSDSDYRLAVLENPDKKGPTQYVLAHQNVKAFNAMRHCAGNVARRCKELGAKSVSLSFVGFEPDGDSFSEFCQGFVLGTYTYSPYKSDAKKEHTISVTLCSNTSSAALKKSIHHAEYRAEAQNMARDLSNMPPNDLTPEGFVNFVKKNFKSKQLSIKAYTEKDAKKMKMSAFLAVAQGSSNAPYLLKMTLNASSKEKPIILVGKGVTFDSGGLSLKPSNSMIHMKGDMGGAAAVVGAMHGLVKSKSKRHVIALVPLVENMPSADAYRPSDVITAMNGKTIEITNTDAEGRLILADSLCYAVKQDPRLIVDVATLTGAASVALGEMATALLGNSEKDIEQVLNNQEKTGERLWRLPLYDDYLNYLKSDIADIINCNTTRNAGTCTAAKFLEQFVDKKKWLHLDIAPTMHNSKTSGFDVKGMSGVGARTLIECVETVK